MDEDATSLFDWLTQSLFDPDPDDNLLEVSLNCSPRCHYLKILSHLSSVTEIATETLPRTHAEAIARLFRLIRQKLIMVYEYPCHGV